MSCMKCDFGLTCPDCGREIPAPLLDVHAICDERDRLRDQLQRLCQHPAEWRTGNICGCCLRDMAPQPQVLLNPGECGLHSYLLADESCTCKFAHNQPQPKGSAVTVNANVRCIEWFGAEHITPTDGRFVIGWFPEHYGGMPIIVRQLDDRWHFQQPGPGMPLDATPSHWCEYPDGPCTKDCMRQGEPHIDCPAHGATSGHTQGVNDGT